MKKETSNQFTDGLMSDINALNTPNTVLTDALNATIITYDGNEYSLQNDRGNYPLKYCKLKPNYIPIGTAEYGGIMYIISYNPLDNRTEIGSYPSPLIISEAPKQWDGEIEINSAVHQAIEEGKITITVSEIAKHIKPHVFNGEDFKLNPGDEYYLMSDSESTLSKYEELIVSIIDENSKSTVIKDGKDLISQTENWNTIPPLENYNHVTWAVPGWFVISLRLAEIGMATINTRHFYMLNDTVNFQVTFKLNLDDLLILNLFNEQNNYLQDIGFKFRVVKNNEDSDWHYISLSDRELLNFKDYSLDLGEFGASEWYANNKIAWKNITGLINNISKNDTYAIEMIPTLTEVIDGTSYNIEFDTIVEKVFYNLSEVDNIPWKIASNEYAFMTDVSNSSEIIRFNVEGPSVSSNIVSAYFSILDVNENVIIEETKVPNYSGLKSNEFKIPFTDTFVKEQIYIIILSLKDIMGVELASSRRILITSELFNDFSPSECREYDKIDSSVWLSNYGNHVSGGSVKVVGTQEIIDEVAFSELGLLDDSINNIWSSSDSYTTFVTETGPFKSAYAIESEDTLYVGNNISTAALITPPNKLNGPIWENIKTETKYTLKDGFNRSIREDSIIAPTTVGIKIASVSGKKITIDAVPGLGGQFSISDLNSKNIEAKLSHDPSMSATKEGKFTFYITTENSPLVLYKQNSDVHNCLNPDWCKSDPDYIEKKQQVFSESIYDVFECKTAVQKVAASLTTTEGPVLGYSENDYIIRHYDRKDSTPSHVDKYLLAFPEKGFQNLSSAEWISVKNINDVPSVPNSDTKTALMKKFPFIFGKVSNMDKMVKINTSDKNNKWINGYYLHFSSKDETSVVHDARVVPTFTFTMTGSLKVPTDLNANCITPWDSINSDRIAEEDVISGTTISENAFYNLINKVNTSTQDFEQWKPIMVEGEYIKGVVIKDGSDCYYSSRGNVSENYRNTDVVCVSHTDTSKSLYLGTVENAMFRTNVLFAIIDED